MASSSAYMQRSRSLLEFVSSLDEEISLPYLSVSVSHHGLSTLTDRADRAPHRADAPAVSQPDGSAAGHAPAFSGRRRLFSSFRRASLAEEEPSAPPPAESFEDALETQPAAPPPRRQSFMGGLSGLSVSLVHDKASDSRDAITSPLSLTVDYAPRRRGITVTVAPVRLRVRKRYLLLLLSLFKCSMVVGLLTTAHAGAGSHARIAGYQGLRAAAAAPAVVMQATGRRGPAHGTFPAQSSRPLRMTALTQSRVARHAAPVAVPEPALFGGLLSAWALRAPPPPPPASSTTAHPLAHAAASAVAAFGDSLELARHTASLRVDSLAASCSGLLDAQRKWLDRAAETLESVKAQPRVAPSTLEGLVRRAPAVPAAGATVAGEAATNLRGFDKDLALVLANLCGIAYHCDESVPDDSPAIRPDLGRITLDLHAHGMDLLETFRHEGLDTFAMLTAAREDGPEASGWAPRARLALGGGAKAEAPLRLYLVFRGSVSAPNKDLNLDFFRCGFDEVEPCFDMVEGLDLSPEMVRVHRGFLRAWRSIRADVLAAVRLVAEAEARKGRDVELYVTGHSLGGALAMLAGTEIEYAARRVLAKQPFLEALQERATGRRKARAGRLTAHKVYTFACPRLGNLHFAELFARTFSDASSFWAVQSGGDAVPHLPLQAMGFHHPQGRIVTLNKYGREGINTDTGDDRLHAWFPRGGNPENWVRIHDIESYGDELANITNF